MKQLSKTLLFFSVRLKKGLFAVLQHEKQGFFEQGETVRGTVARGSLAFSSENGENLNSACKAGSVVKNITVALIILSFILPSLLYSPIIAEAAFNEQINYQGKLQDNTGATVSDGNYSMVFSLYTVATGGSNIWTETQTVPVSSGLFSAMLGSSTALTGVDFNQTLYLGVNVAGDGEMLPRKVLGAVPAAFTAETLSGVASSSFLRSDQADTITATESSTLLSIVQNGTGDIFNLFDGGSEVFTVAGDGQTNISSASGNAFGVFSSSTNTNVNISNLNSGSTAVRFLGGDQWIVGKNADNSDAFQISQSNLFGTNDYLTIDTGGNVGIGTTSPQDTLYIFSDSNNQGITLTHDSVSADEWSLTSGTSVGQSRFGISQNDNLRFTIDNVGRIGVGTTSPSSRLDVWGDLTVSNNGELISYGSDTLGNRTYTEDNYVTDGQTFTASIDALDVQMASVVAGGASYWTQSGADIYYSTGNVGIGTSTNLSAMLTVAGDVSIGSASSTDLAHMKVSREAISGSNSGDAFQGAIYIGTDGRFNIQRNNLTTGTSSSLSFRDDEVVLNNSNLMVEDGGLAVGLSGIVPVYDITLGDDDTGIDRTSEDTLGFFTAGNQHITIDSLGRLGVGTTSPSSVLDVWGDVRVGTGTIPTLFVDVASGAVLIGTSTYSGNGGVDALQVDGGVRVTNGGLNIDTSTSSGGLKLLVADVFGLTDVAQIRLSGTPNPSGFLFSERDNVDIMYLDEAGGVAIGATTTDGEAVLSLRSQASFEGLAIKASDGPRIFFDEGTEGSEEQKAMIGLQSGDDNFVVRNWSRATTSSDRLFSVQSGGSRKSAADSEGRFTILHNGNVGIGFVDPARTLSVDGDAYISGALYDNNGSAGTAGYVLESTGSGFRWVATTTLGLGTGGSLAFTDLSDTPNTLTANRIPFTNSAGTALTDASSLTYDGKIFQIGGPTMQFFLNNNVAINPDILFANNGLIAAESSLRVSIDADDNATDDAFIIHKNGTTTAATEVMRINEDGQIIFDGDTDTYIGSGGADTLLLTIADVDAVTVNATGTVIANQLAVGGVLESDRFFSVSGTLTGGAAGGYGTVNETTYAGSLSTTTTVYGDFTRMNINGYTSNAEDLRAIGAYAAARVVDGDPAITGYLRGVHGAVVNNNTNGNEVTLAEGVRAVINNAELTGAIGTARGLSAIVTNAGEITTGTASYANYVNVGTTTTGFGMALYLNNTGQLDTYYGIFIDDVVEGSQNNSYALWAAEGDIVLDADGDGLVGDPTSAQGELYFGEGQDAALYFNGTDFVIDSQVVGSGDVVIPNGSVGIGNTNPNYDLHVTGDTAVTADFYALNNVIYFDSGSTTGDYIQWQTADGLQGYENGNLSWKLGSNSGESFVSGSFGVGTTSPSTLLSAEETGNNVAEFNLLSASADTILTLNSSDGVIAAGSYFLEALDGGVQAFAVRGDGAVTAGTWNGAVIDEAYLDADLLVSGDIGSTVQGYNANTSLIGQTIETGEITNGTVAEVDLDISNAAADELCLTYESTGAQFEWQSCASGSLTTADIDTSAELAGILTDETGIAGSVVFSQEATLTGTTTISNSAGLGSEVLRIEGDSDAMVWSNFGNGDYSLMNNQQSNGIEFYDGTGGMRFLYNGSDVMQIDSTGGVEVTGNIAVTGTVDGKDIATNAAMLNEAETISANWVNTANPWADNEVSDTLTIGASGSVDDGALSANVSLLGTAIETGEITDNTILEPDLSADVTAVDGDFLQYDSTGTNFTWRSASEVASDIGFTEATVESYIFDADAETITGSWEVQDDVNFAFGNDADWTIQYDEGVDDQLLFVTTNTAAVSTADPMVQFLVGTTPTANQQVFGVAKGTQGSNTDLLTLDEDGDLILGGTSIRVRDRFGAVDSYGMLRADTHIYMDLDDDNDGAGLFRIRDGANADVFQVNESGQVTIGEWNGTAIDSTYLDSTPTFTTVNTGLGAHELYAMDQDVQTTDAVSFAETNTNYLDVNAGADYGLRFWNGSNSYMISMGNDQLDHGTVTDYSIHSTMGATAGRGFTWGSSDTAVSASINALTGDFYSNGDITALGANLVLGSTNLSEADLDALDDGLISLSSEVTGSLPSTSLSDGGTISFDWVDAEIADTLTIGSGGSVNDAALSSNVLFESEIDTSAEIAGIVTDETGTGNLVFSASPTLTGVAHFDELEAGASSGGVALTINDGYGNANVTFNHRDGTPSQAGSSYRIEAGVDSTAGLLSFEIGDSVTSGVATALTQVMSMADTVIDAQVNFDANAGVDVTGNISVTGTVDGKDIATNAAFLNEAETISANWVNTTNPWADNEVSDTLTIGSGGAVNSTALTDGGTIGFDWVDGEVANALTISQSGAVDPDALNCDSSDDNLIDAGCIGDTLTASNITDIYLLNTGDTVSGDLTVGAALQLSNANSIATEADIYIYSSGMVSAADSLWITIDADADSTAAELVFGYNDETSSASRIMTLEEDGDVGIGESAPTRRLEIFETAADDQFRISYNATVYTDFQVLSTGDLVIDASGGDVRFNDEDVWICEGGACPNADETGTGNLHVENNVSIAGKLDVATIDPVYTIGGVKYATYGMSSIGIEEQVNENFIIDAFNEESGYYEHSIDWSEMEKGTDLWLFYQVTDLGELWEHFTIALTAGFDGKVFYEKDLENNALIIKASAPGEVSAAFSAKRFDWEEWDNLRPDQDSDFTHFVLPEKP